jgi:hypothetical protein
VAKQPRKQTKPKSITVNPLFPAVVALWFGALFGLGSLAVRPSLFESLVIKSRIDLLIPAAAPPLGVTARALVALVLAAIGSAIGIAIARRIARPKPEVRERKRSTLATYEGGPARRSYAAAQQLDIEAEPEGAILANRRRGLTPKHEVREFVPHEMAPLPGGAPHILDISSVGFGREPAKTTLDLGELAAQARPVADGINEDHAAVEASAAAADGRQVFGLPAQPERSPDSRQIFGQPVKDEHVSQDFVRAAGFQTSVFETPAPTPLFAQRDGADLAETSTPIAPFVVPVACDVPVAPEVPAFAVPSAEVLDVRVDSAPPNVAPLPSPASLDMTDLAARLAESMARRRAARAGQLQGDGIESAVAPLAQPTTPAEPSAQVQQVDPAELEQPRVATWVEPALTAASAPVPEAIAAITPVPIPAAMRPLELDRLEDQADVLADLLPPRRFSMPAALAVRPIEASSDPLSEPVSEAEIAESEGTAQNYASLLELATPVSRGGFVRIEESEAETAAIEPVVIFPGQMAHPLSTSEGPNQFCRFDSPASAGQGQPVSALSEAAPSVDREESERALRMALANLQRMSGAA